MNIQLMSDLHLEFGSMDLPGGDVLLLAGDICVADYLRSVRTDQDAIIHRKICDAFFKQECSKYSAVYYIMGNHEHYNGTFENSADLLRNYLEDTNVTLLTNEAVTLGDWTLFGGTMWTNYRNANPMSMGAARSQMSDHHVIRMRSPAEYASDYRPQFRPEDAVNEHNSFMTALTETIDAHALDMRKMIVMSHHAPSYRSIHEMYRGSILNDAYASDLDHVIESAPHIKYWFHGHMHDNMDYMVDSCRVVCNPRGYYGHYLNPEFNSDFVIEL